MTEHNLNPPKSRRRFMADLLFLGGGLTAAAVLAKTHLGIGDLLEPEPDVAGLMEMPLPAPEKTPNNEGSKYQPGSPIDGDYALPEGRETSKDCPTDSAESQHPALAGKPMPPQASP